VIIIVLHGGKGDMVDFTVNLLLHKKNALTCTRSRDYHMSYLHNKEANEQASHSSKTL